MLLSFRNQFLTHIYDHLIVHWGICFFSFFFDVILYFTNNWTKYKRGKDYKFPDNLGNVLKLVLFNQFFVTFPMLYFLRDTPEGSLFELENLYKIPFLLLVYEIMFFYSHIILHMFFYERIHKIHHRWIEPMAISATYAHPFEHFFSVILPVILAAKWTDINYTTTRSWHIFALVNTLISAHGGYKFSNMHAIHHARVNCNFGALGLLDWLHGTYEKA